MTQPTTTPPEVELRLHGVSGTPPAAMLETEHPRLVAGDPARTSFWRAAPRGSRVLEGYSWGGLTSGGKTRALWLLLLPFTLLNVAAWTHPPLPADVTTPEGVRALRRWRRNQRWLRVLALGLTLLVLLTAANLTADLLAYQCAADQACRGHHRVAAWLHALPVPVRLVVGMAIGPGALLGLLGFLGQSTWRRFETRRPGSRPGPSSAAAPSTRALIEHPGFFDGDAPVRRLRQVHLGAGSALIGLLLAACVVTLTDGASNDAGVALALACGLLLVASAVLVGWPALGQRVAPRTPPADVAPPGRTAVDRLARGTRIAGLVLAVGAGLFVLLTVDDVPAAAFEANLPGLQAAVMVVFLALCVVWVVHALTLPGVTTVVMTAMSLLLASALSAGLALATASYLGRAVPTATEGRQAERAVAGLLASPDPRDQAAGLRDSGALVVPPVFFYSALTLLAVAVVLLVLVVPLVRGWRRAALPPGAPDALYPDELEQLDDASQWQLRRLRRTWYLAGLTDSAGRLALCLVGIATLLAGLGSVTVNVASLADWLARRFPDSALHDELRSLSTSIVLWPFESVLPLTKIGVALAGALALGLVGVGRQSLSQVGTRRTVGIVWDLGTFWPRAAHPLAAPCYSERVVPELHDRMRHLLAEGNHLVLSAHSQGTVIAAAALLQMPDGELCQRAGLLTYGSPLRRLYQRYFPAYFGDEAVQRIAERLHCRQARVPGAAWRNLWRGTDPIGGPVFGPDRWEPHPVPADRAEAVAWPPDWQLVDPPTLSVPADDIVLPSPRGHSGYFADPAYALALDTVFGLLTGPPPPPTAEQIGRQEQRVRA